MNEEDKENSDPNATIATMSSCSGGGDATCISTTAEPPSLGILYCKARGMPLDHIGSNATLQFQNEAYGVHGAELKCTHVTCMTDGIKFRYCKPCNKAVAKRNFRKRHAHPEFMALQNNLTMPSLSDSQQPARHSVNPALPASQHHATPLLKNGGRHLCERIQPMDVGRSQPINYNNYQNELTSVAAGRDVPSAWVELYQNRPQSNDIHGQEEWLLCVLSVAGFRRVSNMNQKSHADEESSKFTEASNSITAVKEEFRNNFPPRFVTCDETRGQGDGMLPRYRQHAESLSLQINTNDMDLLGTSSLMLGSNGSIKMLTPKT